MPTPRPAGSFRCFDFQSDRSTTRRMHSASPIVPMRNQLAVSVSGLATILSRNSAGSSPSFSAILSSCTSWPNRGCGVPCPRFGPHGGLFVKTRAPSNLYRGSS